MDIKLSSPVTQLRGIGPSKAGYLQKLGITHVRDLLYTFPRRYDDFSVVTPIAGLKLGQRMTVRGKVDSVKSVWGWRGRRRLLRITVGIADETGMLQVMWFNLRFLPKQLWQGRELLVAGEVEQTNNGVLIMRSPVLEFVSEHEPTHTARITPVYPETYGVSSRWLRYQVKNNLPLIETIPEYIPADIRRRQTLIGIHQALRSIHFPSSSASREQAQRRLRFDELFFLQLSAAVRRQHLQQKSAFPIALPASPLKRFIKTLPFQLTNAQECALNEVTKDLTQPVPMNRLLHGDVGSGKSVVALLASWLVLQAGYKVVYLAPTEILARQQAEHFSLWLGSEQVALLVGSLPARTKTEVKQRLRHSQPVCIIGTHALLQEEVTGQGVALAIIDEQHRFGVTQRHSLTRLQAGAMPHLLSMTATPIPRTLTLTVYGDLDVSVLNELPPHRRPVKTEIILPEQRERAIIAVLQQLHQGRQAYTIAPLVEQSEKLEVKSAKQTYEEMKQLFPGIAVGLLHGAMPTQAKESVMRHFVAGAIQLLVSTAVVEVGVNVPNATAMIIEGAERFGLSQLHQFRGRIGRSEYQSFCYLFPTTEASARNPRLTTLTTTTDGFAIAEADLQLRGPGEVYGVAQSGFGNLKVASLLDYDMIKQTRAEAERLLKNDPALSQYPILRRKAEQKNTQTHFE